MVGLGWHRFREPLCWWAALAGLRNRAGILPLHSETRGKLDFTRFHSYQDWYEWNQVVNQAASEVCCSLKEAETQNLSLKSQQNKAVCLKKVSDTAGRIPAWLILMNFCISSESLVMLLWPSKEQTSVNIPSFFIGFVYINEICWSSERGSVGWTVLKMECCDGGISFFRSETRRLRSQGKVYRNPYDFSPWHNWCLFLGMIDGRGWTSGETWKLLDVLAQ